MESHVQYQGPALDSSGFQDPLAAAEWDLWNAERTINNLADRFSCTPMIELNLNSIRTLFQDAGKELKVPEWFMRMVWDYVILALRHAIHVATDTIIDIEYAAEGTDLMVTLREAVLKIESMDAWLSGQSLQ